MASLTTPGVALTVPLRYFALNDDSAEKALPVPNMTTVFDANQIRNRTAAAQATSRNNSDGEIKTISGNTDLSQKPSVDGDIRKSSQTERSRLYLPRWIQWAASSFSSRKEKSEELQQDHGYDKMIYEKSMYRSYPKCSFVWLTTTSRGLSRWFPKARGSYKQ
jgi:hypothetical protein